MINGKLTVGGNFSVDGSGNVIALSATFNALAVCAGGLVVLFEGVPNLGQRLRLLDSGGDEQNLKLVFTTHEIAVRGHHLRRIETVMQRMELSLLAKLPNNQRKLITEGQPVILEILVTEMKSTQGEHTRN